MKKQSLYVFVLMTIIVCGCTGMQKLPDQKLSNLTEPGLIESYTVEAVLWNQKVHSDTGYDMEVFPPRWEKVDNFGYKATDDTGEFYMIPGEIGPASIVGFRWKRDGKTYYAKLKKLFMNNGYTLAPYYEKYKGSDGITEAILVMGIEGEVMFLHLIPHKKGFSMEVATYRTFKHPNN